MALTDADRLQMTAIALMKHSVMRKTVDTGSLIIGESTELLADSSTGLFPLAYIGTSTLIE